MSQPITPPELYQRLEQLEQQMSELRAEVIELKRIQAVSEPGNLLRTAPKSQSPVLPVPEKAMAPLPEQTQKAVKPVSIRRQPDADLEKKFGQNIMGIIASVMIFISLLLFVSFVYRDLGVAAKAITLYTVSIGITAAGMFLRRKHSNAFTKSLSTCGIGACYISILMTYFQLHLIGQIGLYLLIAVWMAAVAFLAGRLRSSSAAVIGQMGITVSVLMGSFQCDTLTNLYLLLVFFVFSSLFYQVLFIRHRSYAVRVAIFLMGLIACIGYTFSAAFHIPRLETLVRAEALPYLPALVVLIGSLYVWYLFYLKSFTEKAYPVLHILVQPVQNLLSYLLLIMLIWKMLPGALSERQLLPMFIGVILFWIISIRFGKSKEGNYGAAGSASLTALILLLLMEHIMKATGTALIWLPVLAYGFGKRNKFHQVLGLCALVIHGMLVFQDQYYLRFAVFLLGIAGLYGAMWLKKEEYVQGYKITGYLVFLLQFNILLYYLNEDYWWAGGPEITIVCLGCTALINIAALKGRFARAWNRSQEGVAERGSSLVCRVINGMLWALGLILVSLYDEGNLLRFILILVTLTVAFIGSRQLVTSYRQAPVTGLYLGMKATLTIWIICESFSGFNSVMASILFIILAIISILAGFKLQMKSFRLYGLGLSMAGVFKLLLFDLQYSGTLQRIGAFFVAGVLCFIINFIYNYVNKNFVEKDLP